MTEAWLATITHIARHGVSGSEASRHPPCVWRRPRAISYSESRIMRRVKLTRPAPRRAIAPRTGQLRCAWRARLSWPAACACAASCARAAGAWSPPPGSASGSAWLCRLPVSVPSLSEETSSAQASSLCCCGGYGPVKFRPSSVALFLVTDFHLAPAIAPAVSASAPTTFPLPHLLQQSSFVLLAARVLALALPHLWQNWQACAVI